MSKKFRIYTFPLSDSDVTTLPSIAFSAKDGAAIPTFMSAVSSSLSEYVSSSLLHAVADSSNRVKSEK